MARPKVALLSADRIADAAIELIDSGQPFGVNALARRLSVSPSSLYNHVRGRDDIIELARGRIGHDMLPAEPPSGSWDEVVAVLMRAQREVYAAHPYLLPYIVVQPMSAPEAIASYDFLATALLDGGFPEDEVLQLIAVMDAFAIGFGLDLASPDDIWAPATPTKHLARLLAAAPRGRDRSDAVFETGLEMLLGALRLRLDASRSRAGSTRRAEPPVRD